MYGDSQRKIFMLSYTLNKNLDGNKIVQDIVKFLQKYPKDQLQNSVLKISLEKITDYTGDNPLPKIEYKETTDS